MTTPSTSRAPSLVLGLAFIAGMTVFGLIARHALLEAKKLDEFVTVKGLSEREVPANLAIWPISFTVIADDLAKLPGEIQRSRAAVHAFLTEQGFAATEISNAPPQIQERPTPGGEGEKPIIRYQADLTVLLRSDKVPKVKAAMEVSDKLVQQGIALSGSSYQDRVQFLFTGLNEIKPGMIGEANQNARRAAEKFAADSQASIGAIRHAVQGPFEINQVDPSAPERKIVRVVTTVDFYLK
jgi:uncharacterized protein